jgi:hypothetical protein
MAGHGKEERDARDDHRIANTQKSWRKSMTRHLTQLTFVCIALAFAAAAPVGAQGTHEDVISTQWPWCPEQPNRIARQSLQDGVDLEPHHAAVLAACAEQSAREQSASALLALGVAAPKDR